jgi:hypothetical protein
MPTNRQTARDESFAILSEARLALSDLLPGAVEVDMRWQGIETPEDVADAGKQQQGKFWTRAVFIVLDSRQNAHMLTDGPNGSPASWRTLGQVIIQVFAPRNVTDAFHFGSLIADAVADIYRNVETASGVGFERATAKDQPSEAAFWRWNVEVDFEYYERKD